MSLRQQLTIAVILFLIAVTVVVTGFTVVSNERAEKFTWSTMLNFEMDRIEHSLHDEDEDSALLSAEHQVANRILFYRANSAHGIPAPFTTLPLGVHDDLRVNGRLFATLVRGEGSDRRVLAVDVTTVEDKEAMLARQVLLTIVGLMLLFGTVAVLGLNRFLRPLRKLSDEIALLSPEKETQTLPGIARASSEIVTIADAVNGYVERNRRFLEREREFINTASHELRTPIAVLRNNLQLAQSDVANGIDATPRLERSERIVSEMEQLLGVLLVLAKDPEKLAPLREDLNLMSLVREVAEQHAHLLPVRELHINVFGDGTEINAPPKMVQIALSNVIRNAIENSDRGTIDIEVAAPGVVTVKDPGHGMTPQEISALYAKAARGGGGDRQLGIGLQLLARICSHLGWSLEFAESHDGQTQATLRFPSAKKLS